jgi:hypothetical protein
MTDHEALIVGHHTGSTVRFAADKWEAEALAARPDADVVVVREWIAPGKDHLAWIVGPIAERAVILDRATGAGWTWEMDGVADEEGFTLYTFAWIDGHLIGVYLGDHHLYLTSLRDRRVTVRTIHGDAVRVLPDRITVQEYGPGEPPVRVFALPGLEALDTLSMAEAKAQGIAPYCLEYHPEHNHYPLGGPDRSVG